MLPVARSLSITIIKITTVLIIQVRQYSLLLGHLIASAELAETGSGLYALLASTLAVLGAGAIGVMRLKRS